MNRFSAIQKPFLEDQFYFLSNPSFYIISWDLIFRSLNVKCISEDYKSIKHHILHIHYLKANRILTQMH